MCYSLSLSLSLSLSHTHTRTQFLFCHSNSLSHSNVSHKASLTPFTSVTRLGDLLHFGQLFQASGNNCFTQIAHIFRQFGKGGKIFHFSTEIIYWATFIDIWRLFTSHTALHPPSLRASLLVQCILQITLFATFLSRS